MWGQGMKRGLLEQEVKMHQQVARKRDCAPSVAWSGTQHCPSCMAKVCRNKFECRCWTACVTEKRDMTTPRDGFQPREVSSIRKEKTRVAARRLGQQVDIGTAMPPPPRLRRRPAGGGLGRGRFRGGVLRSYRTKGPPRGGALYQADTQCRDKV